MSKAKSGGGRSVIGSGKGGHGGGGMSNRVPVRTGKPAEGHPVCGTIGLQRITTTGYREPTVPNPKSVPLGNQTALSAGQGPGAGRDVHRAGSQQGPGPAQPMRSTDPLKDY